MTSINVSIYTLLNKKKSGFRTFTTILTIEDSPVENECSQCMQLKRHLKLKTMLMFAQLLKHSMSSIFLQKSCRK